MSQKSAFLLKIDQDIAFCVKGLHAKSSPFATVASSVHFYWTHIPSLPNFCLVKSSGWTKRGLYLISCYSWNVIAAIQPQHFGAASRIPPPPWPWCVFGKVQTDWLLKMSPRRPTFHALMCSFARTSSQLQNEPKISFLAKKLTKIWHFAWKDCMPNPLHLQELHQLCTFTGPTSLLYPILVW